MKYHKGDPAVELFAVIGLIIFIVYELIHCL